MHTNLKWPGALLHVPNLKTTAFCLTLAGFAALSLLTIQAFRVFCLMLDESEREAKKTVKILQRLLDRKSADLPFIPQEFDGLQPLQDDIYLYTVSPGSALYFRQSPRTYGMWEWSDNMMQWQPTSELHADNSPLPDPATMIFLTRLHLEYVLRAKHARPSSSSKRFPAPLDFRAAVRCLEDAPECLCCPISQQIMQEPVCVPSGQTFDRASIMKWISINSTDPTTGAPLTSDDLYPNLAVRDLVERWTKQPLTSLYTYDTSLVCLR